MYTIKVKKLVAPNKWVNKSLSSELKRYRNEAAKDTKIKYKPFKV